MPRAGDSRTVEIEALAAGGRGVAREDGVVWFVSGAIPGDRGEAQVVRTGGRFVEARLLRLERPSPERVEPPCPVQSRCGGCPWMVLGQAPQRVWKRGMVVEALSRIGGLDAPPVEEVRQVGPGLTYRNRVEFTVARGPDGAPAIGLISGSHLPVPVDVERCLLQHESANAVLGTARRILLDPGYRLSQKLGRYGPWRMLVRRAATSGEIVVGLGPGHRAFPGARKLAARLREAHPDVVGVVRYGRRGAQATLAGRAWIKERVCGIDFRVPATAFVQVSEPGAEALSRIVVELAGEVSGTQALDLYGGIGVYAFALCRAGAREVTVCDVDGAAVRCGRQAAGGEPSAPRFVTADVGRWLARPAGEAPPADLVVANPPRSGLGRGVAAAIARREPRRIVLVSCDPATLARDVKDLVAKGYDLSRVVPVDLFPQTAHVEAVALLLR